MSFDASGALWRTGTIPAFFFAGLRAERVFEGTDVDLLIQKRVARVNRAVQVALAALASPLM